MIYVPGARAYAPDSLPTLQVVCNQQKRHSVDHTLLDVGLGDIAAQAEIESRQLSANASRSMGELIENVNTTFHKRKCARPCAPTPRWSCSWSSATRMRHDIKAWG